MVCHDGTHDGEGGPADWLALTDVVGLAREALFNERHAARGVGTLTPPGCDHGWPAHRVLVPLGFVGDGSVLSRSRHSVSPRTMPISRTRRLGGGPGRAPGADATAWSSGRI
ncbi:hypothetical protein [Streptomyces sp. NBC_00286]|uniref:hypothetical protein n=1 Tax=Streptomyces sp. NBC_00286 TaxID=2975701 RepID=UPI002E2CC1F3|nr:hypothetical protein [Streptomyces sp. NBC_00286]